MSEPDPGFDAYHPSGQLLFRSCHGGYLHSVILGEEAMAAESGSLPPGCYSPRRCRICER